MKFIGSLIELRSFFDQPEAWSTFYLAVMQDYRFWSLAHKDGLLKQASKLFSKNTEEWTPGAVSLLSIQDLVDDNLILQSSREPLPEPLHDRSIHFATSVMNKFGWNYTQVSDLCMLTLYLREIWSTNDHWGFLDHELSKFKCNPHSILACLFGLTGDSMGLFIELLQPWADRFQPNLALHALFSNPLPENKLAHYLDEMLERVPLDRGLELLRKIQSYQPSLACKIDLGNLSTIPDAKIIAFIPNVHFQHFTQKLQLAEIQNINNEQEELVKSLTESLDDLTMLEAEIAADVARISSRPADNLIYTRIFEGGSDSSTKSIDFSKVQNPIHYWNKALQIQPDEPTYITRLALAYIDSGRISEAEIFINGREFDVKEKALESILPAENPYPLIYLPLAMLGLKKGDIDQGGRYASKTLDLIQNQSAELLSDDDFIYAITHLVLLFHSLEEFDNLAATAELGIRRFPYRGEFQIAFAYANYQLNHHGEVAKSLLANNSISPSKIKINKLLSVAFENSSEWVAALQERERILETQEHILDMDYVNLAYCAFKASKPGLAKDICAKLQHQEPDVQNSQAFINWLLGEAELSLGAEVDGLQLLKKSLEIDPSFEKPWLGIAKYHLQQGESSLAEDTLRRAWQALPDAPQIQFELGKFYFNQEQPATALPHFKKGVTLLSDNPERSPKVLENDWQMPIWERVDELDDNLLHYARTLLALGYISEAREIFEKVYEPRAEQDETDSQFLIDYAKTLASLEDFDQAVPLFETIVNANPANIELAIDYGNAINKASIDSPQLIRGVQLLGDALRKSKMTGSRGMSPVAKNASPPIPQNLELMVLLAEAQVKSGDYQSAIPHFRHAINTSTNFPPGWKSRVSYGLGKALFYTGENGAAIALFQDAAQLDKTNPEIQRSLSEAYLKDGLYEQALQTAYTTFQLNNSDLDTLTWFANQSAEIYRASNGLVNQANSLSQQALERASSLSPHQANILLRIGVGYAQTHNDLAALSVFKRVVSAPDATHEDLYTAARYLKDLGDTEQALAIFTRIYEDTRAQSVQFDSHQKGPIDNHKSHREDEFKLTPEFYMDLAETYCLDENYPAATHTLDEGINKYPDYDRLYRLKSKILIDAGLPTEAVRVTTKLLELDPESIEIQTQAAWVNHLAGNFSVASEHIDQVITRVIGTHDYPAESEARSIAAQISYAQLQLDRAYQYLNDFPLEHATPGFLCIKAEIELDKQLVSESRRTLSQLAQCSPASHWNKALALRHNVQLDGVVQTQNTNARQIHDLEESLGNLTGLFELISIARLALEIGHWSASEEFFAKAIELYPFAPLIYLSLAQYYVICAVTQKICSYLDIVEHAPGERSLSTEISSRFDDLLEKLTTTLNDSTSAQKKSRSIGLVSFVEIEKWKLLKKCLLSPDEDAVNALISFINSNGYQPLDILVLLLAKAEIQPSEAGEIYNPIEAKHPLELLAVTVTTGGFDLHTARQSAKHLASSVPKYPKAWLYTDPILCALQAKLAFQDKDYSQAFSFVNKALDDWDSEPRWYAMQSLIALSKKEYDPEAAFEGINKAIQLEPAFAPHYALLSKLYARQGDNARAAQVLEKMDDKLRDNYEIWMQMAENYKTLNDLHSAETCIDKAISYTDGDKSKLTDALYLQGILALESGKAREALERAKTIIHIQDENPNGYNLLSKAYEVLDKPVKAIAAMEMAAKVANEPLDYEYQVLHLKEEYQDSKGVAEAVTRLVKKYKQESPLLYKYARILYESDEQDSALHAARDALRYDTNRLSASEKASLHLMIGRCLREEGQLDQAIHHLNESLELDSSIVETFLELGHAHMKRREYPRANQSYQKAIRLDDTDARAYYYAGMALKENNEFQQAELMLRRASKLAPSDLAIKRLLGAVVVLNLVHGNNQMYSQPDREDDQNLR